MADQAPAPLTRRDLLLARYDTSYDYLVERLAGLSDAGLAGLSDADLDVVGLSAYPWGSTRRCPSARSGGGRIAS